MSGITDFDTLRQAMAENYEQPEGPARNARAEQLLAEAEKLNIPLAVIEALGHQLKVYNYSSEKGKMFVPFARLLRMWDERPEDFDQYEIHSLHWVFKWMSAGMLGQPHIPLASIEKWLGEMEHRYRLAGHSERAVRGAEFSVAHHIGDLARAERAYAAWLAADRDTMADCHACELHDQGWWQVQRGADAEALELWRPVLEGEYTCAHEPHAVLASSLLPLLRLGRADEARAHHLRGFRLVRAMESMRGAYADHVEFCALSGNEARALELLAERPAYFTDSGEPRSRLDFMAVVALLMDRLTERGLGEQTVPGPAGRAWTARELALHARVEALSLAARFDERNGTSYVSERARARMDRRPLIDRLPLGVRSARPVTDPKRPPVAETAAATEPDLTALLVVARRLTESMDPEAVEAWAAVARAAEDGQLGARDRAEIADHEAMGRGPEGIALFERAAQLYAEAGDPGEALAARARGAYAHAGTGRTQEALESVQEPYDEVLALFAADGTGVRQTASVLVARARILMLRVHESGAEAGRAEEAGAETDTEAAQAAAEQAVREAEAGARELLALVEPYTGGAVGLDGARVPGAGAADAETAGAADGTRGPVGPETGEIRLDAARVPEAGATDAVETAAVVGAQEPCTGEVRLAARAAEARAMLAELAAHGGDVETAAELFTQASRAFVAAGLPWFAVEYQSRLAGIARHVGDAEAAERAVRAALEYGGRRLEPAGHAQLHLQLADTLAATGQFRPASEHALEAAHWADEGGQGATLGAWARHRLGGFLLRQERWAEAAEVLESALPDLTAETHGDGAIVQTQWWLGDCLTELGEHRGAAERWLQAADIARHWPEQRDHAMLAHLAAEALGQAELPAQADQAYARAGDLWRSLGNVHGLIRSLRARAWLAARGEAGLDGGRELMAEAVRECERALVEVSGASGSPGSTGPSRSPEDEEARERLLAELGQTHRQFGDLVARSVSDEAEEADARAAFEEALAHVTQAITAFGSLGEGGLDLRTGAELSAGWLEADLRRPAAAAARARAVLSAYAGMAGELPEARRSEAERMRGLAEAPSEG
ncbi:tetratricopeptide repeat protein [Streptomyces sp. NPDC058371]|uniref:tetratricopeptide repeat protein n=1 Tax=Streptomyces sp. NPDC058371 TaxID=3346463 RepID=UPI003662BFD9